MYQEQINAYFEDKRQALIDAVSRLVAIPSVKGEPGPDQPFGEGPDNALREAVTMCRELGLSAENMEGYVGTCDLNSKETSLHILAHLDVVVPGPGWTVTEPYEPKLEGDLLYGRGTTDDKGPLVAALFAMKAVRDLNIPLSKNVRLIMGTDEESGFADIKWYYDSHPYAPYTFSPDASFPLTNLEKGHFQPSLRKSWEKDSATPQVVSLTGSAQINVVPPKAEAVVSGLKASDAVAACRAAEEELGVTFSLSDTERGLHLISSGLGTHASTPEEGNNALTALITLLCRLPLSDCDCTRTLQGLHRLFPHGDHLGEALGIARTHPLSGPLTLTFTMIDLNETGMKARFDSRTCLGADEENCLAVAQKALEAIGVTLKAKMTPVHHTPEDSHFVQTLLHCYEQYTGQKGACLSTGGGTYVHGIPGGVAYGISMPGFDSRLHGPDERVSIPDLLTACKIFTQAIIDLCQ